MSVECIDFSCKHEILIRNADGSFIPMDEPYFESEQIDETTWKVKSAGDYCYVLKGDGVAFAVDCGYGAGNIRKYMESLAGVPVTCVMNSHDHFDHSAMNAFFEKAYMSAPCVKYATIPYPSYEGIDFHADEYERVAVKDGDVIPLPGRELVCIDVHDHTFTSMLYLDKKNRILFTGDEFFGMPFKPLSGGLTSWVSGLRKVKAVWDDFDFACGGNGVLPKEHLRGFIDVAEYALAHPESAQVQQERPGDPGKGGGPGGPKPLPDHDGHTVYDRSMPHAGDHAVYDEADLPRKGTGERVVVELNGFRIAFDKSLIND